MINNEIPQPERGNITSGIQIERYGKLRIIIFNGYSSTNGAISPGLSAGDIPRGRIYSYVTIFANGKVYVGYVENTSSTYSTLQARFYNPAGTSGVITGQLYGEMSYIAQ